MTTAQTIYLKDYTPYPYDVLGMDMTLRMENGITHVVATGLYKLKNPAQAVPLVLNGEGQKVLSVALNGLLLTPDKYNLNDRFFTLPCPGADVFTLTFTTDIKPEENLALEGLYKSGDTWCTQCESEGFRKITYYPDRPDVLTTYKVRLEADKKAAPVLLANGNLIESGDLPDGRHFATFEDPFKKPCYLFAVVAGDLVELRDSFTTKSGRTVRLSIFTREDDKHQVDYAMHALKCSMKWDEDAYGLEYDLDQFSIVAVHDFVFGAMENKSLNIFNTKLVLAHPETATDADYQNIMRVVGHEYFHNYSGNRVTCRDWFQLTLKEGLTVFRENQFGQAMFDADDERIDEVKQMRELQFAEDAGGLAHPIRPDSYMEINNFYTTTVYEKGGEVIRMIQTLLGPEAYRAGTDLYFKRHDGQAVTCEDFVQCMEDASGQDLSRFRQWYAQAGTPRVKLQQHYDAQTQQYRLTLSQTTPPTPGQPVKAPLVIPVAVQLLGHNGQALMAPQTLVLQEETQHFVFDNIAQTPVPSVLRGFSAPVILETDLSDADKLFLIQHDTDGYVQWDALQSLYQKAIQQGGHLPRDLALALHHIVTTLADTRPALLSRLLTLPSLSWLAQVNKPFNPAVLHAAREQLKQHIGQHLMDLLLQVYKKTSDVGTAFSAEAPAIARRSLHNTCLAYITAARSDLGFGLATAQYTVSQTMTARMGALHSLIDAPDTIRTPILNDFYTRFKTYPLVLDKWFAVQAQATRTGTLDDIKKLVQHADYSLTNPNRARSVVGVLAMSNLPVFHDVSGEGYRFICQMALKLDSINPAVSARLFTAFKGVEDLVPDLKTRARSALTAVLEQENLSSQAFEVVSKILGVHKA